MKKIYGYAIPGVIVITGVFFAIYSLVHYDLFSPTQGPMQGAVPMVLGILLSLTGVLAMFQVKDAEIPAFDKRNWSIILAVALIILFSYIIGFIPSVFVFLFVWLKFVEKLSWKISGIVTLILMTFVIGVFVFWMEIPFTEGILAEIFIG